MCQTDYTNVTEMAGEEISQEQLFRLVNRYLWAASYTKDKDVIEVACGTGPGLGYLDGIANSLRAGDYSQAMVDRVLDHYGNRIECLKFDAQAMPYEDNSADVILIFEALYYVPDATKFVEECKRILRPNGVVLVSNANSDLFDFNPSPHSFVYHSARGLGQLFASGGFATELWGSTPISKIGLKQRILRPVKKIVVSAGLMPKSMFGKRILKRFVFGEPVHMPAELSADMAEHETPVPLTAGEMNTSFKVIYCAATLIKKS